MAGFVHEPESDKNFRNDSSCGEDSSSNQRRFVRDSAISIPIRASFRV